jgi:glutamyl-tRNA synthetase
MALLGWSSGTEQEVFSREELIGAFSLERVQPSPAVFDHKRLDSLNGLHIRRMASADMVAALEFHLPETSQEVRRQLVPLLQERMVTLRDAVPLTAPLLGPAPWDPGVLFPPKKVDAATATALIDATVAEIQAGGLADPVAMRQRLTQALESRGVSARDGFRVLYVAILGRSTGVPVFDAMAFIGAEKSVTRLQAALGEMARRGPAGLAATPERQP